MTREEISKANLMLMYHSPKIQDFIREMEAGRRFQFNLFGWSFSLWRDCFLIAPLVGKYPFVCLGFRACYIEFGLYDFIGWGYE